MCTDNFALLFAGLLIGANAPINNPAPSLPTPQYQTSHK